MDPVFSKIKHGLIVSCQAEGESPFNSPEGVVMFAQTAKNGGAVAIRSEGIAKTKRIIETIGLPVVGLVKSSFPDGSVRITGSFKDLEGLLEIGTTIIAVDGTFREREGMTGPEFIAEIKQRHRCILMADIATVQEGMACAEAGADCVSSTLSGYTPQTASSGPGPDVNLVQSLSSILNIPVIAEGRINTPELAAQMQAAGAWSIVVGSAITRPAEITSWFVRSIGSAAQRKGAL
ncbi:MAG: N-acetylmannosamine-6-phosphate 2-epimerase [Bacteroidetes bacterium]|nr:N-acetylmannosamine-6-phosphate 2-epimerase [Bacteroidota bacterium]